MGFSFQSKIGAKDILGGLERRGSYAFIGLTGPEDARSRLTWLREEVSKAGEGPSVISIMITAGMF